MQSRSYEASLSVLCLFSAVAIGQGLGLKSGFVPDATTATKIAEAVLVPLNGQKKIASERPFRGIERQCPDRTWQDRQRRQANANDDSLQVTGDCGGQPVNAAKITALVKTKCFSAFSKD
jgi:hypothetical protein